MSGNPLQDILTPSQFQQCVRFYEADQKLDHGERVALATQLQTLAMKTSLAGYTSGMLGFFAPTMYYRAVGRFPTPLFLVQRPFFSLVLGFGTLLVGNNVTAKYLYEKNRKQSFADKNIGDVWQTMDFPYLNFFTLYYSRTSVFPNFIMRDPRTCSYQPLKKENPHFTEATKLGHLDNTGKEHVLSVWDKVRLNHGGGVSK
ncbi:conserved hypothetical protein [Candida dubliniensis CD36]|uniref:Transmembrane protein n=1 Tax=Candida dubliniensis (strain CD36 / ATCC MYA-646 / CBS 7987 / NCPF 3949 / NRRL Y-17841) TaxID=573826 RepID=B9WGV7_CANDC|nr:conserved hypothetical protein [Candida dubliniensis CD36]CAX41395.1 conserved hypothetical protein [Candida dubliniensis CD36]